MPFSLPPMYSLVVFDVVAQYLSFSRAAQQLQVTQSAVSRQIAQLEHFLGRALFIRSPGKLTSLTPAGVQYARFVHGMLDNCSSATAGLMKQRHGENLTIACAAGTSILWLAPRLPEFISSHPETSIRVIVMDDPQRLLPAEFDIGIYYTRDSQRHAGIETLRIAEGEIIAVCAPSYLDGRLVRPDQLAELTLLDRGDPPAVWMTWQNWFNLCGIKAKPDKLITSNNYPFLVQMATQGQGVLLGWKVLIGPLLDADMLVKASEATASMGGYYMLWPTDRMASSVTQEFKRWVIAQFGSDVAF